MQMSTNISEPTAEEFIEYVNNFQQIKHLKHAKERAYAITSGWQDNEYSYLYRKYLLSIQGDMASSCKTSKEKGDALENLARYFLEYGGVVKSIKDISAHGKWQVDGQGVINKSIMEFFWGEDFNNKVGFQLYLECKNHSEPMEKADFNDHCTKMDDNNCNFGISASTSGFKITGGKGIAERVYLNTFKNKFYLLLSIRDFDLAHFEKIPPISIIIESLSRTTNDLYRNDPEIQKQYTKDFCQKMAKDRYLELSSSGESN